MKKRYLKTVEDFLEFKDTDTKIYNSCSCRGIYYKFVNGYFCRFDNNEGFLFNVGVDARPKDYFVLEEERLQEATEKDIGKLCWFWDTYTRKVVGKLREVLQDDYFPFRSDYGIPSVHCRPLTKEEIKEFMEKAE